MDYRPVESSNVAAIGYDAEKRELHVRFKSRELPYVYHDVPPETHDALMKAESIGRHIHRHIKGRHKHSDAPA